MLDNKFHRHINSQTIRERHRRLYEELYQACTTVVSAPALMVWTPTYAVGPGGIGLVSKLPLRLYIGIEPLPKGKVEFGPTRYYIPERDEFQDWGDPDRCNPVFLELLEKIGRQHGYVGGARIWCLSEVPWYRGLNVDTLYSVPSAVAWLVHLDVVTPREVEEMTKVHTEKLAGQRAFEKIFRFAWRLDSIIGNWLFDGHTTFACLIDSPYPVVFFRERDPFLFDHYRDFGLEHASSFYNISDSLFFRGARLNELFTLETSPAWPIDIALLFTGEEGDSLFAFKTRMAMKAKLDQAAAFAAQTFTSIIPETFRQTPRFLELSKAQPNQSSGMSLFQVYRETSTVHSMTVFKTLVDLFQYGAAPNVMGEFLDAENLCQDILRLLGFSSLYVDQVCTALRAVGSKMIEGGVAARLMGFDDRGCVTLLGPRHSLEPCLNEILPHLSKETKKTIHCHFASWCDGGSASQGVRVEQHVASNVYSNLINGQTSVTVLEWMNGDIRPTLYTADKWPKERNHFDVLLDEPQGKIYTKGEAMTSSDLHSSKQTIALLGQFFAKQKKHLKSDELTASYYMTDRNQMESKIIRPLVNAVLSRTKKNLGLTIHGGLGRNFTVALEAEGNLRLGLVKNAA